MKDRHSKTNRKTGIVRQTDRQTDRHSETNRKTGIVRKTERQA